MEYMDPHWSTGSPISIHFRSPKLRYTFCILLLYRVVCWSMLTSWNTTYPQRSGVSSEVCFFRPQRWWARSKPFVDPSKIYKPKYLHISAIPGMVPFPQSTANEWCDIWPGHHRTPARPGRSSKIWWDSSETRKLRLRPVRGVESLECGYFLFQRMSACRQTMANSFLVIEKINISRL